MARQTYDAEALARIRQRGAAVVQKHQAKGPDEPLERVAWLAGLAAEPDALHETVLAAREEKYSWAAIGAALGMDRQNAHRKYGGSSDPA